MPTACLPANPLRQAHFQCLAAYADWPRLITPDPLPDMDVIVEPRGCRYVAILDHAYPRLPDGRPVDRLVIGWGDSELAALNDGRDNADFVFKSIQREE